MKRKHYSPEFKSQVVKDAVEVGNASIVAAGTDCPLTWYPDGFVTVSLKFIISDQLEYPCIK